MCRWHLLYPWSRLSVYEGCLSVNFIFFALTELFTFILEIQSHKGLRSWPESRILRRLRSLNSSLLISSLDFRPKICFWLCWEGLSLLSCLTFASKSDMSIFKSCESSEAAISHYKYCCATCNKPKHLKNFTFCILLAPVIIHLEFIYKEWE